MPRDKIVWYAPTWATAQKQWWALRKCVLSSGPLLRITLATIAATLLVLIGFKMAFPAIVIPNLLPMLFVLPMLVLMLTLQTYALARSKARVMVSSKKILVTHGQSATNIKSAWLTDVILAIHNDGKARLRFCYSKGNVPKFKTVGVSDDLDLIELEHILPVQITPRDYRRSRIAR